MLLALFSLAVGIASGFAGGGRFANVGWRRIRASWLPAAWAGGSVLSVFLDGESAFVLGLAGLGCLVVFAAVNMKVLSCMWLIAAGLFLNFVVTANNHGMPYSPVALATAGVRPESYNDVPKSSALSHPERPGDQLLFLADVIPVAPLRTVVSFGDLLAAFGLGSVAATAMWDRRPRRMRPPRHLRAHAAKAPRAAQSAIAEQTTAAVKTALATTAPATTALATTAPATTVLAVDTFMGEPLGAMAVVQGEADTCVTSAPDHTVNAVNVVNAVNADGSEAVHQPRYSARLLLLEATGDPSVLIDLGGDDASDLVEVTATHVLGEALRRHALDERLVARAVAEEAAR